MSDPLSSSALIAVIEQARQLMQERRWKEALTLLQQASANSVSDDRASRIALAQVQLFRANVLRDFRQPGSEEAYQASSQILEQCKPLDHDATNLLANVFTNQGIAWLDGKDKETLQKALSYFDESIELRSTLPQNVSPLYEWGLAAAWMNRADALMRLEPQANQKKAKDSHEEALKVLNRMPEGSHPSLPARRALALMNCALLGLDGSNERVQDAATQLDEAIRICQTAPPQSSQECLRVLIGIQLNRSILLLQYNPKQSWLDAKAVLALTAPIEKREILTAEAGLKARHLLCHSLTMLPPQEMVDDWICEATDAVDEGLALVREWPPAERAHLMNLNYELFRFGLLVYRIWQPHFLSEFILENIDCELLPEGLAGDPIMHQLALEAIWSSVVDVNKRIDKADSTERARLLPIIENLQVTEKRLQALRETLVRGPAQGSTSALNAL